MTRFNITLTEAAHMALDSAAHAWGGEILVPKDPPYRITDVAAAVGPRCQYPGGGQSGQARRSTRR